MDNPEMEDSEAKHFRVGKALDTLLTSTDNFNDFFEVVDVNRPLGLMGKFVDNLPKNLTKDSDISLYDEAYDKSGYKMKKERVVERFWGEPDILNYYNAVSLKNSGKKSIISKDEYDSISNMKKLITNDPYTYPYFYNDRKEIELLHQVVILFDYFTEDGSVIPCKAMLDGIKINHKEKTFRPYDLKSTGKPIEDFLIWWLKYGYYRQAAFYTLAIKSWYKKIVKLYKNIGIDISDYKLLNFQFIVVESKLSSVKLPIIYECTDNDIHVGIHGGTLKNSTKRYPGVQELLEDYHWHTSTNLWERPRKLYDSKGKIELDAFQKNSKLS